MIRIQEKCPQSFQILIPDNPPLITHKSLGYDEASRRRALASLIRSRQIVWAGNRKLKIYGTLRCGSGKKMKEENRVFFGTEQEALSHGYRPCGHCIKEAYRKWKDAKD